MVNQSSLDLTFAALADPVRRAVLARLRKGDEAMSSLASEHPMSLPAFMKHMRTLERAGLVTTVKTGRVRTCQLCEPGLVAAESWLRTHRAFWERQLESLDRFFEQKPETQAWTAAQARNRSKPGASSRPRPRAFTTRGRRRNS